MCNRDCKCLTTIFISLLLGVLIGFAFFIGVISGITAALIIALVLAAFGILTILLGRGRKDNYCICDDGRCLLLGIFGTIVTATIALSITLATGSIGFAILIGAVGFFAVVTLLGIINVLFCIIRTDCCCC